MLDSQSVTKAIHSFSRPRERSVSQPESAYPVAKCQRVAQILFNEEALKSGTVKRHRADRTVTARLNYTDKPDRLAEPLNYTKTSSDRSTDVPAILCDYFGTVTHSDKSDSLGRAEAEIRSTTIIILGAAKAQERSSFFLPVSDVC